mmetsp:Transcript_22926/g.58527  ORF Transcript_22926/g.58527 Transcript_22926/m.58527 type:complete len:574 (-) Transcript_22926:1040-2761(-)
MAHLSMHDGTCKLAAAAAAAWTSSCSPAQVVRCLLQDGATTLRGSVGPRGHLGSTSTCFSTAEVSAGGMVNSPSLRRSTPAQATISPLSVQYLMGGYMQGMPNSPATAVSPSLTAVLAATPPATTRQVAISPPCCAQSSLSQPSARRVRCCRKATTVRWKEAAMSAATRSNARSPSACASLPAPSGAPPSGPMAAAAAAAALSASALGPTCAGGSPSSARWSSTSLATLVLSPLNEKLHDALCMPFCMGSVSLNLAGSPPAASRSRCGPPGMAFTPSRRATLSKHSPALSSSVVPRMRWRPMPWHSTSMLWPPDTSSSSAGKAGGVVGAPGAGGAGARGGYSEGRRTTSECASMWCTGTRGIWWRAAMVSAWRSPTCRHRDSPGPTVTATALSCSGLTPASCRQPSTVAPMAAACASRATSGFTPPYCSCSPVCEAILCASTVPSPRSTAAAVSSQLLSMPSTTQDAGSDASSCCTAAERGMSWPDASVLAAAVLWRQGTDTCGSAPAVRQAASTAADGSSGDSGVMTTCLPTAWMPVPLTATVTPRLGRSITALGMRSGHSMRHTSRSNASS